MASSEVRYARSGAVNIAYQVVGDGAVDLLYIPGWISHLDLYWEEPSIARFLNRMASGVRRVSGIAVHIGARIAALAASGEVLVSSTVKDLVAGSGLSFEERGPAELKGVPGEWRLYLLLES